MEVKFVAAMVSVAALSGCASITSGSSQSLSVETIKDGKQLVGATCELTNDKGKWFVTTPGSVTVHRAYSDMSVKCTKEGIDPGIVTVKSSTKGIAFGNILAGGLIGAAVDMKTGAAYDYPTLITVNMGATSALQAPTQPKTEGMQAAPTIVAPAGASAVPAPGSVLPVGRPASAASAAPIASAEPTQSTPAK